MAFDCQVVSLVALAPIASENADLRTFQLLRSFSLDLVPKSCLVGNASSIMLFDRWLLDDEFHGTICRFFGLLVYRSIGESLRT